jgi:fimbrial chaperone protein
MKLRRVHAALFLLLASLLPVRAEAFRFVPFTADFAPSGPGANQTFRVENNSEEPIAVEISVHRRAMNLDGSDALTPADDDFVVFPAQVVPRALAAR